MDLTFAPDLEAWREEVRTFLHETVPPEYQFESDFDEDEEKWAFAEEWNRQLGQKRWVGIDWPEEYEGLGKPRIYRSIMMEEFGYHDAPLLNTIGWGLAASAVLSFGTDEQKKKFIPPIIKFETHWVEGLTEPDSGSDLASLKTTAVRDGDDWIVNGQKTFTTWGSHGEVLYLAARTNPDAPKHRGITIFCMDMKLPGVTMSPLFNLAGGRQNHTFMDNVRIPNDMMVGEEGMGWHYIMNSFYGGAGGGSMAKLRRVFEKLVDHCKTTNRNGRPLSKDPYVRHRLADLAIEIETLKMVGWDGLSRMENKGPVEHGGALGTVIFKEFQPRFGQLCMEILGPLGQIQEGSRWAPMQGEVEHSFRKSFANHAGGTSQVKRMVMATRGLGLPR